MKLVWGIAAGAVLWGIGSFLVYVLSSGSTGISKQALSAPSERPQDSVKVTASPAAQRPSVTHPPPPPSAEKPATEQGSSATHFDGAAALAATLEADYATEPPPTTEARAREQRMTDLFAAAKLGNAGELQEFSCRQSICRGVIRIANEATDNEIFNRTLLSPEFALAIPTAVSVTSREKRADGSILATFFTHPQDVFESLPYPRTED